MGLYTKFMSESGDCRAYYLDDGLMKRVGADENGNVNHPLTEAEVMEKRQSSGIPFASLKTESEILALLDIHLPE